MKPEAFNFVDADQQVSVIIHIPSRMSTHSFLLFKPARCAVSLRGLNVPAHQKSESALPPEPLDRKWNV